MNANEALNRTVATSGDCHESLGSPPVSQMLGIDRMKTLIILAFLALATALSAGDWEHAPKSSDYVVKEVFSGKPAPVKISNQRDRTYRTILRDQAKDGPNFAGHYTMVVEGCGLDSLFVAVVDSKTGNVYWPPFRCISLAGGFDIPLPECTEGTVVTY